MPIPKIIAQPHTHQSIKNGVSQLVNAIQPTLGPLPRRLVYHDSMQKIELLDDGGTIARRIIQIENRSEDVGAMLLRQVLWQVYQQVGDGTATTAVLFEAVYNEGLRYLVAGVNAMRLRVHLMSHLREMSNALIQQTQEITTSQELKSIAFSVCYDETLADVVATVMDTVGQYGQIDVRSGHGRSHEYRFVEGTYWKGGAQSKDMLRGTTRMVAEMTDAAILVTDMDIKEPQELVAVMQLAIRMKIKKLLIIVQSISEQGIAVVMGERVREMIQTVVVKIDGYVQDDFAQAQQDIAILTGATPILKVAGQTLDHVKQSDFGYARWAWADDKNFGFAGGKGDPRLIRDHVATMRQAYDTTTDDDNRQRLLNRLGKLNGGTATVYIGGVTDNDIKDGKELAERTIRTLRSAIAGGIIQGGGTALLKLRDKLLEKVEDFEDLEEQAACRILAKAVEAPIRTLLTNAGYEPSARLAQLQDYESTHGFDVLSGEIVHMKDTGIVDVANVQKQALERAVSSAALALTIDVLVLHRNPQVMTEP